MPGSSNREVTLNNLIAARRKLHGNFRRLARQLHRKGIELVDVYGKTPGVMDLWSNFDSLLFIEPYTYRGPEASDRPETRWRTLGYHWQFRQGGSYRLHLQMVVVKNGQPELRVLYEDVKFSTDPEGWQAFLAYLKKERLL